MVSISKEFLFDLWKVVAIAVLVIVVLATVCAFIKNRKNKAPGKKTVYIISLVTIFLAAVSWITNLGATRMTAMLLMIPFLHIIIFFLFNLIIAPYADKSNPIKLLNILFCITFLLSYIFMPDKGAVGSRYFFFGLIHNDKLSYAANIVSLTLLFANTILFIWQIIISIILKIESRK